MHILLRRKSLLNLTVAAVEGDNCIDWISEDDNLQIKATFDKEMVSLITHNTSVCC